MTIFCGYQITMWVGWTFEDKPVIMFFFTLQSGKLYLCNYPFLFDAHAKLKLLETDQSLQVSYYNWTSLSSTCDIVRFQKRDAMQNAAQQAALAALFSPTRTLALNQFLVLNVTRDHIVQDTLRELSGVNPNDLKKPLRVSIVNEFCKTCLSAINFNWFNVIIFTGLIWIFSFLTVKIIKISFLQKMLWNIIRFFI